jgi:hypothetical protein
MSWHCSRALVEAFSVGTSSDGDAYAPLSSTPTPDQFFWPDKTTEHSRLSRFGMTCEPLTADRGEAMLTWFREVSLARTSASLERGTAWTASVPGSGRKWLGLLGRYDHDSRSWRTRQCSLLEDWEESLATFPRWGSMRNGECWERETWEPLTNGTGSGSWPTPTVCWNYNRPGASATSGMGLASAVRLWPTPRAQSATGTGPSRVGNRTDLQTAVKLWPTPQASDNRNRGTLTTPAIARRIDAGKQVMLSMSVNGPLNPDWVEWLMGWPIGLTDLRPLETVRFREWRQQHGVF